MWLNPFNPVFLLVAFMLFVGGVCLSAQDLETAKNGNEEALLPFKIYNYFSDHFSRYQGDSNYGYGFTY